MFRMTMLLLSCSLLIHSGQQSKKYPNVPRPVPGEMPQPKLTFEARQMGMKMQMMMKFLIDENGNVDDVRYDSLRVWCRGAYYDFTQMRLFDTDTIDTEVKKAIKDLAGNATEVAKMWKFTATKPSNKKQQVWIQFRIE
jgi:outer membrane biosynthesis protein TonB